MKDRKSSSPNHSRPSGAASARTPGRRPRTASLASVQRKKAASVADGGAAAPGPTAQGAADGEPGAAASLGSAMQVQFNAALGFSPAGDIGQIAAQGLSGSGSSLPHGEAIQRSFGRHDVSSVQAHSGGEAGAACADMGAEAFTSGNQIAFSASPSLHLAAHESAHVVQQRAGVQLKGGVGQEGDAYERHADAVADLVVQGKSAEPLLDEMAGPGGGSSAVQMRRDSKDFPGNSTSDAGTTLLMGDQELYSTKALIKHGNTKLKGAGKKGSFIKLVEGDPKKHEGHDLVKVVPTWDPKGGDAAIHKGAEDANKVGGKDTEGNTGGPMALWTDCGKSSGAVTGAVGAGNSDRQGVYNKDGTEVTTTGRRDVGMSSAANKRAGRFANAMYFDLIPGFIKKPANLKYLKEGVHYDKKDEKVEYKAPADGLEAQTMYGNLTADGQDKFDKEAGVNHYANPEIGEAYTMATGYDLPGFKGHAGESTWNFHYAGVIMKDGADNITLENYAVTSETAKDAGVNKSDYIDRDWNFALYGTVKTDGSVDKSETFHHDHLATKTHGTKATSMAVRTDK